MPETTYQIYIAALSTALLMIVLVSIIIIAILRYQNKYREHLLEVHQLKDNFQKEIIKAQLEIQEQTSQMLSMEIHDNIGQILSLAKLKLNQITEAESGRMKINSSIELIGQAIKDLRELSKSLNGTYLSNQTLTEAIQFEVNRIKELKLVKLDFDVIGNEKVLSPEKRLIAFRIIQEALGNSLKHSQANSIKFVMSFGENLIDFSIEDDGCGFKKEALIQTPKSGTGLTNMSYRADLLKGNLTWESAPGEGTTVKFRLPILE